MSNTKELDEQFRQIQLRVYRQFKKNPDLNALLFLIGMRELGSLKTQFSKEEKVQLMHIATCKLLSYKDYYVLDGLDENGWPHWIASRTLPKMEVEEQEYLLKQLIIRYFAEI